MFPKLSYFIPLPSIDAQSGHQLDTNVCRIAQQIHTLVTKTKCLSWLKDRITDTVKTRHTLSSM